VRWAVAISAVLAAWLTIQTIVVAQHTSLEADVMAAVAVTVVCLALALSTTILGAATSLQWLRRRRLTTPSPRAMAIAALAAGLLVCPIGFDPLPPDGVPASATGEPCDGLAPLPEVIRGRASHHDPRLAYSDGCSFDL
jgi:hypothetical protein